MLNDEHLTVNLLEDFMENIRLEKNSKAKENFKEILSKDWTLGKRSIRILYEIGEIFAVKEARHYINEINRTLDKKQNNLFLRVMRQEMAYNSNEYDIKDLIETNKKDLKLFTENPYLINFKGLIFLELEKYDKAIRYIDQALDLDKDNVDFMRNKAIVYMHDANFPEAHRIIQQALGIEPTYSLLRETRKNIDQKEVEDDYEDEIYTIRETMDEQEKSIKNIKFEFIQIFALFVVILTVVVKVASFNYENFRSVGFFDIIVYQLAINSSWLFAVILILALIIFLHIRRNN